MKKEKWNPWNEILRAHEWYVYVGNVPDTLAARKAKREFAHENGRRVIFIKDRGTSGEVCGYVSEKFYPSLCNVMHPAYGSGLLKCIAKRVK